MIDIGTKIDNDPSSAGKLTAVEFNHIPTEIENAIKPFIELDENDSSQLHKAMLHAGGYPIDTISDLREMEIAPEKVYVSGYNEKNDGAFGSNIFKKIESGEDNKGTIIKNANGITYELQYGQAMGDVPIVDTWFDSLQSAISAGYKNLNITKTHIVEKVTINNPINIFGVGSIVSSIESPVLVDIQSDNVQINKIKIDGDNKVDVCVNGVGNNISIIGAKVENAYSLDSESCLIKIKGKDFKINKNELLKSHSDGDGTSGNTNGASRAIHCYDDDNIDCVGKSEIISNEIDGVTGEEGDAIQISYGDVANGVEVDVNLTIFDNNIKNFNRRAIKAIGNKIAIIDNTAKSIATDTNPDSYIRTWGTDTAIVDNKLYVNNGFGGIKTSPYVGIESDTTISDNIIRFIGDDTPSSLISCDSKATVTDNKYFANNTADNETSFLYLEGDNIVAQGNKSFNDGGVFVNIRASSNNCQVLGNTASNSLKSANTVVQISGTNCIIDSNVVRSLATSSVSIFRQLADDTEAVVTNNKVFAGADVTAFRLDKIPLHQSGNLNIGGCVSYTTQKIVYGTEAPTGDKIFYNKGDICFNQDPGASPQGWFCKTYGAPGDWEEINY